MRCAGAAIFYIFITRRKDEFESIEMAHATQITGFQIAAGQSGESFFASAWAKYQQYRLFRETVNELKSLPNRDLADLGISRSAIIATAREAVYGA